MYKSFFKIAWRNILKNRGYSYINIVGLTIGMTVTILIGVWVLDETSFNMSHSNYSRIAEVHQHRMLNGEIQTGASPRPLAPALRSGYSDDFRKVVRMWWPTSHTLSIDDNKIPKVGTFIDKEGLAMFTFSMIEGSWQSLDEPASVILSQSTATALFGPRDPINQMLSIDHRMDVKVTGVYKDFPMNSTFHGLQFVSSWELWESRVKWVKEGENNWNEEVRTFVELRSSSSFAGVSDRIKMLKSKQLPTEQAKNENPVLFLHPMSQWHLYSDWKNGKETGSRAEMVWLIGIIGGFVLVLACINFMNLSTAQSQLRAREVGIRKSVGSVRRQLIVQFFTETFLLVVLSYVLAIGLASLAMPGFNDLAEKDMSMPWSEPGFILVSLGFVLLTSILAGGYPALFLSSFQPIKVLKGTFKLGQWTNVPRKVLVTVQFVVSVSLIIGTITVWRQIQFAKDRPVGYTREGLIMIRKTLTDFWGKSDVLRNELKTSGAIVELSESANPPTENWFTNSNFNWQGKDPDVQVDFVCSAVTHEYGRTVGWRFKQGRDFSKDYPNDSSAVILNEATARLINWQNPLDEEMEFQGERYKVIGIIQNVIAESPYETVKPGVYFLQHNRTLNLIGNSWIIIRLNPDLPVGDAISRVQRAFQSVLPAVAFDFKFVDEEFETKFSSEKRVGKLALLFAVLAIFISCLGLFGLASFVAQQRTKEIGIRKVLGATAFNVWKMLSADFMTLVVISSLLAVPLAYYLLNSWLEKFEHHTEISWWIVASAIAGAILITLLTVSYQATRAALTNPVKSLKSE